MVALLDRVAKHEEISDVMPQVTALASLYNRLYTKVAVRAKQLYIKVHVPSFEQGRELLEKDLLQASQVSTYSIAYLLALPHTLNRWKERHVEAVDQTIQLSRCCGYLLRA